VIAEVHAEDQKELVRAMARIVVDPVTRIEGHLRVEAVVENGVITDAFSSGTMVRGLEKILIGRDPARRLGHHRACLRRVYHGACAGQRAARLKMRWASPCRPPPSSSATS
jgi:hypothetical protein